MKKTILVSLAGLTLFLTGCTQQAPTANQGINQPTANINQNVNQPVVNQNQNTNQPSVNVNQPTANVNQNQNTNQNLNTNQPPSEGLGGGSAEPYSVELACENEGVYSDQKLGYKVSCPKNWVAFVNQWLPNEPGKAYSIDFIPKRFFKNGRVTEGENHYLPTLKIWVGQEQWERSLSDYVNEAWQNSKGNLGNAYDQVTNITEVKTLSGIISYQYSKITLKPSWYSGEDCIYPFLDTSTFFLKDKNIIVLGNPSNNYRCLSGDMSKKDLESDIQAAEDAYEQIIRLLDWTR